MENKEQFIREYGELLARHEVNNIEKCEYLEENGEEYFKIIYRGGHTKKVCITCDSLWAIIIDTANSL